MGLYTDNRKFMTARIDFTQDFPLTIDPGKKTEICYPSLFELIHTDDILPMTEMFTVSGRHEDELLETHCRFLMENGEYHWFFLSCIPKVSSFGRTEYIEGTMCDVSQYLETVDDDLVYKEFRSRHENILEQMRSNNVRLADVVSLDYLKSIQVPFSSEKAFSAIYSPSGELICVPDGQDTQYNEKSLKYKLKSEIRINHITTAYWVIAVKSKELVTKYEPLWRTLVLTVSQMANAFVALVNEMSNSQDANKLLGQNVEEQILMNNIYSITMQSRTSAEALDGVLALTGEYMKLDKIIIAGLDDSRKVDCIWRSPNLPEEHRKNVGKYEADSFMRMAKELEEHSSCFSDENNNELAVHGVKAYAAYKLFDCGTSSSAIIYEIFGKKHRWTQRERTRMKNISQIISSIIMRLKTEGRLEESQEKLRQLAFYDSIFGIPNRTKLMTDVTSDIENGSSGALIAFNITNKRKIAAVYGHTYSDMLLRNIAKYLEKLPVSNLSVYYFTNGVFILKLKNAESETAKLLCEMLVSRFSGPWIFDDTPHNIYCAMGIAFYPDSGRTAEQVSRAANVAMYRAMEFRNNSYAFFKGIAEKNLDRNGGMERTVSQSVKNGMRGFSLHFQPVFDNGTGAIKYCESLLRFNTGEYGHVPSSVLFPIAENLGLLQCIDDWVLKQSCNFCKRIRDMGHEDFMVSVNLSIGELETGVVVDEVRSALEESGLPGDALILEIPVKSNLSYTDSTQVLSELKALGVNIAIDSYGTEDVSLKVLKSSYLDFINVPKKLLISAEDNFDRELVMSIVTLSHCRNVRICIKGIEDKDQLEKARECNADFVQGYLCARPMIEHEAIQAIERSLSAVTA